MSDRGMKKWNAYKSLVEQQSAMHEMSEKRNRVEKPVLTDDQMEAINNVLSSYNGEMLKVSYFENNNVKEIEEKIKKIDVQNRKIILENRKSITFDNIINLERI